MKSFPRRGHGVVDSLRHARREKQPREVVALPLEASVAALLSAHLPDDRPKTGQQSCLT